jgi:1,4-dihydroxy-2-naphthoate octaprenyltransferase
MLSLLAIYVSLISALFAMMILYINGFPDRLTDEQVGKKTLVVYLGEDFALRWFMLLPSLGFGLIILGVWFYRLPLGCFFALLGLPFAIHARHALKQGLHNRNAMTNAIKYTILFHFIVHIGLIIGLVF